MLQTFDICGVLQAGVLLYWNYPIFFSNRMTLNTLIFIHIYGVIWAFVTVVVQVIALTFGNKIHWNWNRNTTSIQEVCLKITTVLFQFQRVEIKITLSMSSTTSFLPVSSATWRGVSPSWNIITQRPSHYNDVTVALRCLKSPAIRLIFNSN